MPPSVVAPEAPDPTAAPAVRDESTVAAGGPTGGFGLLVALAAGAVVLLSTWGLAHHGLWLDEAISLGATHQMGETFTRTAGTMGSYYVLLDLWTSVVGSSVTALRALSVVAAAGAVAVALVVARPIVRRPELVVTALVLATSPGLVRYAQEARSYALVVLLTATAWAATGRAVTAAHGPRPDAARRWWTLLAVTSVVGGAAHGLFALQLAAIVASLLVLPSRRELLRGAVPALVGAGTVLLGLSLLGATDIADWVPTLRLSQLGALVEETVSPTPIAATLLLALGLWGAVTLVRRPAGDAVQRWRHLVPVAWALLPPLALIALSVVRPYLVPRYVVASVPGLAVLVAVGAVDVAGRLAGRTPTLARRRLGAAAVALVVGGALVVGQVQVHDRPGDDWRVAADRVAAEARPGDGIAFPSVPLRIPFEAAWRDAEVTTVPVAVWPDRPLGEVRRFDETAGDQSLAADLGEVDRLWVVHQTTSGAGDAPLTSFLAFGPVGDDFVLVSRQRGPDDIEVALYERR